MTEQTETIITIRHYLLNVVSNMENYESFHLSQLKHVMSKTLIVLKGILIRLEDCNCDQEAKRLFLPYELCKSCIARRDEI